MKRAFLATAALAAALGALVLPTPASASDGRPKIYDPAVPRVKRAPRPPAGPLASSEDACTTTTFEGLGDLASIPDFQGFSFPEWLSIIEENVGGSGRFENEPSPVTVAFWLYGDPYQKDIILANPVSSLGFYYASYVSVQLVAYDKDGNVLDTQNGGANYDLATNYYDIWSPLKVTAQGNKIAKVTLFGEANYTGIDDLEVCRRPTIDAVEVTQAIQQYQTIDDLKASLTANNEPPVPIVAGKPGVLRIYFQELQQSAPVTVEATIAGTAATRTITLQANCTPEDARRRNLACPSFDFYFTPPTGSWSASIVTKDGMGQQIESHDLNFTSRATDDLQLRAVSVCDALVTGTWQCASASALAPLIGLLQKIAPTKSVSVATTNSFVRRNADANNNGTVSAAEADAWWPATVADINALYGIFDSLAGVFGTHRTYYGMIRPTGLGGTGGIAHAIPGHAAMGRTSATRLGVETNTEVVAHETGHTLGLKHTNNDTPQAAAAPPGCYNLAFDDTTDWPYADNYIQSDARLEVGFDVAARAPVTPEDHFDVMSYCTPRWISPLRYKRELTALGGGAVTTAPQPSGTVANGPYWTVSGRIDAGVPSLDPIFTRTLDGPTDAGSGTWKIRVTNAQAAVLFERSFTPMETETETQGAELPPVPTFFELIPVQASAARIAVINPQNADVGGRNLGGSTPVVTIQFPAGGETLNGLQTLLWSVTHDAATVQTSAVDYSPDAGAHWMNVGTLPDTLSLGLDFSSLPGSAAGAARIRVYASDGINTGSATSNGFTVPKKLPQATIYTPANGAAFGLHDAVWLTGSVFDGDDGFLAGASVSWSSSKDGALGTGTSLAVSTLTAGAHTITLSGTDSDGHLATATVSIVVAGARPTLTISSVAINQDPTTCRAVTIGAAAGAPGVPITKVEYSVDDAQTWLETPVNRLPLKFVAPGSGFFHVIAHAVDAAGQTDAGDVQFFTAGPCVLAKGDVNADGQVSILDVFWLINYLFANGSLPAGSGNINGTGSVDVLDVFYLINYLFAAGPAPVG